MIFDNRRITIREIADVLGMNAQDMLTTFNDDLDLLNKVITGDE